MAVVVVVVVTWGNIVVVKVEDEDYLMEVEVEVEDWLMNNHVRFGTYHRLDFDHHFWERSSQLLGSYAPRLIWWWWYLLQQRLPLLKGFIDRHFRPSFERSRSSDTTWRGMRTTPAKFRSSANELWKDLSGRERTWIHEHNTRIQEQFTRIYEQR